MRRKIVAGNWKMNKSWSDAVELASKITMAVQERELPAELILFPSFPYIHKVAQIVRDTNIGVGAQNIHEKESGAYTGEVAAGMILSSGASYVLIGHSERRQYFNESGETLLKKMKIAIETGLQPVFCCGESEAERSQERHFEVIRGQLREVIFQLSATQFAHCIVAYEPVWAIGTGKTATSSQAQEMHAFIRQEIEGAFGSAVADAMPILYGGSCKPDNAVELFTKNDIDGGLIGGASLVADDFIRIARSFE